MEKKFDICFKSKGGILKYQDSKTESILRFANEFISHIKKIYPNLPNIYFNLIDNYAINASVKKCESIFFIGINIGTFNLIEDLYIKAQLSKSLKIENSPKLNLINSSKGLEYNSSNEIIIFPFSKNDLNIVKEQSRITAKFIIYHEICHILRGHLGFISDDFNLSIDELNDINDIGIINILQTLEMDADSFATNRSINDILENRILNQDSENSIYKNLETFVYHYSYSIYCFFRIFGFYSLDISKIKSKSHPTPAIRISMIIDNIATILLERKVDNIDNILSLSIEAINDAETDLSKITFFDNQLAKFFDTYNDQKLQKYKLKIVSNWKDIKPKLEEYSYYILP